MNADEHRFKSDDALNLITERIIHAAYEVSNSLGCGFLEKVYENALAHEMRKMGLRVNQQQPIHVHYDEIVVGEYIADIVVDSLILIELKAAKAIDEIHMAQCLSYLRATRLPLALILNFGTPKLGIKRLRH